MPNPMPLPPRKFSSGALKTVLMIFGSLLIITGIIALLVSFIAFWDSSCTACSQVSCTTSGSSAVQMDWSFLWLDVYFFAAVIIGSILIASASNMISKKKYLKTYPFATFCPNCGTLCDKRGAICPKCGTNVDPEGNYKFMNNQIVNSYTYSQNPYQTFVDNQNNTQQTADTISTENPQTTNDIQSSDNVQNDDNK